jgi:ABC-type transport system substrate-binding protein
MSLRRLLTLPVALLLAGGALAGCASTPSAAPSSASTASGSTDAEIDAAWLDDGRIIGLVTTGSSTCIPAADEATLQADGSLAVTLIEPDADTACTRDLVPRVTLVELPEGVDPSKDLAITVTGDGFAGSTDLEGVEGLAGGGMTDYLPSAGWTDTDGQFVLLTWGSSSCAPVISEVAASGPAEVTVTFETPAADQVCTMDMAPRAAVAVVDGLEEDSDVSLVLAGGPEFDNVTIPIYGSN